MLRTAPDTILDAGCGEGVVTGWIADALPSAAITAVDADPAAVAECARRSGDVDVGIADVYDLPFANASFELVVATEVLEHIDSPRVAVRELARVSAGALLLTVPREPFFRLGNLARGRYVRRLGSTPGHVNTWGRRSFLRQLDGEASATLRWRGALPWQLVVADVTDAA